MSSESHHTDPTTGASIDPDEDLFDFRSPQVDWNEEEDLDAVFAQFELEEARYGGELRHDDDLEDDGTLPGDEAFAGLNLEPPAPLPRREREAPTPPLRSPDPAEVPRREPVPSSDHDAAKPGEPTGPADAALEGARAQRAARVVARHPGVHPTVEPSSPVRPSGGIGVRTAAWILVAITSLNVLVALVALRSDRDLRRTIDGMGQELARSSAELVENALRAAQPGERAGRGELPSAPPNPENHPTFELARAELQRGEYRRARQRVYGLLAIIDRLDPRVREDVEARANFLIARSLQLEALARQEAGR